MAKINFKQPKFILPLILLPFLLLGFFVFTTFKGKGQKGKMTLEDSVALVREKGLNADMPNVSTDIANSQVKDKFGAYTEAYKNQTDHSALSSIDNLATDSKQSAGTSSYSTADLQRLESNRKLDSMKRSLEKNRAIIQQRINGFSNGATTGTASRSGRPSSYQNDNSSAEILEALRNRNQNLYGDATNQQYGASQANGKKPVGGTYDEQMRFFKDQMRMVDSMQKANKPQSLKGDEVSETAKKRFDPSRDTSFKPLHVAAADPSLATGHGFNTVRKFKADDNIKAIIDEAKKVTAGARVRIKLLQDIFVGDNIIPAGTFIYGVVSGFQTQRINISITSINQSGTPLPVKLDVYDNDGYLGLYVPSSNFREFTKDVGTQSTSGLSQLQTSNGSTTDIQSSLMSKVFQSSTNTVGKLIAQNKATLKPDYIIYLKENKTSNKF
jgi:conjugative transposon TraM protein